jgi:predicted TIM-barrel fold metal-dependent hydrolase
MTRHPTTFASTLDLARLPWFEAHDGNRLVAVEDSIGPVIDMHTHLGMGFLRPLRIDLNVATPRTAYYLPLTAPIDLERYSNTNIDDSAMFAMKLDLAALGLTAQGMRSTHTAPNLLRDMAGLGIARSVVLPIDLPIGPQNSDAVLAACAPHPELIPFGSVHPLRRDSDARLVELRDRGAQGIKLHPNAQFIAPDHPKTVHLCGRCGVHDLPVLFHCGPVGIEPEAAARRCQVERYERAIADNPDTTFVLGHSGALQHEEAIVFAERYPNTFFELSSLGLGGVRDVLENVPTDRIVYGTDWPFYHQALTLARVLIATEGDDAVRRAVLHDNAARLLALETTVEADSFGPG